MSIYEEALQGLLEALEYVRERSDQESQQGTDYAGAFTESVER